MGERRYGLVQKSRNLVGPRVETLRELALRWNLRGPMPSMVKNEELVWRQRELSVRLALVIRELDFVGAVQELHDVPT